MVSGPITSCESISQPFIIRKFNGSNNLVVIRVRCAIRTVVAVDGFATVPLVGVRVKLALGDSKIRARDDLVQGVRATGQEFAGVAMTE